jgi:hypothetical protein
MNAALCLWCGSCGLLSIEACLDAQRGELAWPLSDREDAAALRNQVAADGPTRDGPAYGTDRDQAGDTRPRGGLGR